MKTTICALLLMAMAGITLSAQNNMPLIAEFQGEHNLSSFGFKMITLDFNHDGYDDLIVFSMAYGYDYYDMIPSRGKVYIYYGGPGFSSASEPAMTLEGDYPNGTQRAIRLIANVGDINGDGYDDLMIVDGIPNVISSVRWMIYYGGTDDLSTPDRIEVPDPNIHISSFCRLGDVDGDGYDDMGIAYLLDNIYYFEIWWGESWTRQIIASGIGHPPHKVAIVGIGDVNNDGFDDFTVGYIESEDDDYTAYQRLYCGNPSRDFSSYLPLLQYPGMGSWSSLPLGDLNGDGFDDFFVYATMEGLMIWYGSNSIVPNQPDVVLSPPYANLYGIKAGDFNGDGFNDVVAASPYWRRFSVWLGSPTMNGHADLQMTSMVENFGWYVAVGDFNGDGYDDIAVSAPQEDVMQPAFFFPGYVFIYGGNSAMVSNAEPSLPALSHQIMINIHPNPVTSKGEIHIALKGEARHAALPSRVEIFNLKGQVIFQSENVNMPFADIKIPIDLSKFPSGVYLCRVISNNSEVTTRFTIIK